MPECPICFGDRVLDCRDDDALLAERFTDAELSAMEEQRPGFVRTVGIIECEECDATGVVSEERLAEIMAATRAMIDQALARARDLGLVP